MRRHERGAATVLAVSLLGVVVLVAAGLGVVAALVVAHRQAQAAADLAALAGAGSLQRGGDACADAGLVAARNEARVTRCDVDGLDVVVRVVVAGPRWLGQRADLVGEARAGPGP